MKRWKVQGFCFISAVLVSSFTEDYALNHILFCRHTWFNFPPEVDKRRWNVTCWTHVPVPQKLWLLLWRIQLLHPVRCIFTRVFWLRLKKKKIFCMQMYLHQYHKLKSSKWKWLSDNSMVGVLYDIFLENWRWVWVVQERKLLFFLKITADKGKRSWKKVVVWTHFSHLSRFLTIRGRCALTMAVAGFDLSPWPMDGSSTIGLPRPWMSPVETRLYFLYYNAFHMQGVVLERRLVTSKGHQTSSESSHSCTKIGKNLSSLLT